MTRKWPLKQMQIRQKGVFDFEELYKFIFKWLQDRKYRTQETKYKNKPTSPWGFEHEVKIYGEKKVDGFYQYEVFLVLHVRDGTDIVRNGKKLMQGRIHITIDAVVTTDYTGRWEGSKFLKALERFYTDHIVRREIELENWDVLYYRLHDFQEDIKRILEMYTEENYFKGS